MHVATSVGVSVLLWVVGRMTEPVTIYTVARWPITAGAKRAAGYATRHFEFLAESSSDAIAKAVKDCEWRDPRYNFGFQVVSTRVVIPEAAALGGGE